jgi:hypothetical protein
MTGTRGLSPAAPTVVSAQFDDPLLASLGGALCDVL